MAATVADWASETPAAVLVACRVSWTARPLRTGTRRSRTRRAAVMSPLRRRQRRLVRLTLLRLPSASRERWSPCCGCLGDGRWDYPIGLAGNGHAAEALYWQVMGWTWLALASTAPAQRSARSMIALAPSGSGRTRDGGRWVPL